MVRNARRAVFFVALLILFLLLMGCSGKGTVQEPLPPDFLDLSAQHRQGGRYTQALYYLTLQGNRTGWTDAMHTQAGDLYFILGHWVEALAHWEATTPTDLPRLRQMAELYVSLENWADATRILEAILAQNPDDPWVNYQLGLILAPFRPERAMTLLQNTNQDNRITEPVVQVLSERGSDPLVSMYVGVALANLDAWLHAERAFQQAALINYPYPEALAYTALARENQGKDGSTWMSEALAVGDRHAQVHYLHGLYLRGRHAYDDSITALTRAVAIDPNNPAMVAELGVAYQLDMQYERGQFWIHSALTLSNDAPEYLSIAADFYAEAGANLQESGTDVLREAVEANPQDVETITNYADALYRDGEVNQAIDQLNNALELLPEYPPALYLRGSIAMEQFQFDLAREMFQQVVDLQAEYVSEATTILEYLDGLSTIEVTQLPLTSGYDAFDR